MSRIRRAQRHAPNSTFYVLRFTFYATAAFALLLALLPAQIGAASPSQAQPKLTVTARGGFGDAGVYVLGEWFPIKVTLDNPAGTPSRRVRVEVDSTGESSDLPTGTYVREVDLPSPSRKEVTLYAYSGSFTHSINVRVMQGNSQLERVAVKLSPLERADNVIVGVASSDASLLNALRGERIGHSDVPVQNANYGYGASTTVTPSPVRASIAHVSMDDIPTLAPALGSLGVLVVDDVDTGRLSEEQRRSVEAWVARGGTLVLTSRPGGADTLSGFAQLAPVTINGTRNLSGLGGLGDLVATPITTTGSIAAANASLKEDQTTRPRALAWQDGVPLVSMREWGQGRVMHLALSPSVAPLKGWEGTTPFFKRMLSEHTVRLQTNAPTGYGYYSYYGGKIFSTYGNLFDLTSLELPNAFLIGCFLGLYILVIGPINFIILRRMRRTELAWITIPGLVLLFSLAAYALAFQSKGGELVTIRGSVANTYDGLPASSSSAMHYLGIFSPQRRTYTLQVPGEAAVTERNQYGFGGSASGNPVRVSTGGNATTVHEVSINTWSLRSFMAESATSAESPLEADLHLGDNAIVGTVRNRSSEALQDVALIQGNNWRYVGHLSPGQRVEVRINLSTGTFGSTSPTGILPLPPEVNDPTSSGYYPYDTGSSDAQRAYNRKVELLNVALQSLLAQGPPEDLDVLALAWGPRVPQALDVVGYTAQREELNLWTSYLRVTGGGTAKPVVRPGNVPFSVYAPNDSPNWMAGPFNTTAYLNANPYADLTYKLPPGIRPDRLSLHYSVSQVNAEAAVLALNERTGQWDQIGSLAVNNRPATGTLVFTDPGDYISPSGDVLVRLRGTNQGGQMLYIRSFDLGVNDEQ